MHPALAPSMPARIKKGVPTPKIDKTRLGSQAMVIPPVNPRRHIPIPIDVLNMRFIFITLSLDFSYQTSFRSIENYY